MEDGTVEVLRKRPGLEDVVGSIQALPNESPDLEAEIEKATEENADRFMRRLEGR